ncbi:MAG TPA: S8 family serine peptidase [Chthoniobacteraceae bacterium]|jgi:hypothetical protein|nr:S8 family serine peptidase [Chthoniobacteraceae bacterium]
MTLRLITAAFVLCEPFLHLSALAAPGEETITVESTGAFLIKLKPGRTRSVRSAALPNEWTFQPLGSGREVRAEDAAASNWYRLAPSESENRTRSEDPAAGKPGNPWDIAYALLGEGSGVDDTRGAESAIPALRQSGVSGGDVEIIEPDFAVSSPLVKRTVAPAAASAPPAGAGKAQAEPSKHWPLFKKLEEYQDNDHSQLADARKKVEENLAGTSKRVRVAFLDTGYDPQHIACPPHVLAALGRNFVEDLHISDGAALKDSPGPKENQSHGTGTIGILASDLQTIVGRKNETLFSGTLGGAPMIEIVPMRVATSVVHVENPFITQRASGTTRAIRYAIAQNCDVISMSHGGLPSRALADAVNDAYRHGIAMFFASGDYLQPPTFLHIPYPVHTPRFVVYPAAFPCAMCVCGVTAELETYGYPPKAYDKKNGPVGSWRLRGNWGPADWMTNAIAAFSPNVPWPHLPEGQEKEDLIDLDGQGTSTSTPQAAAAAALWLQYHIDDPALQGKWRTWEKAELVYAALRSSAKSGKDSKTSREFFGNGILQARAALDKKPSSLTIGSEPKTARVGLGWLKLLGSVIRTHRDDAAVEAAKAMVELEIAQLTQRSPEAQEIISRYGDFLPAEDQDIKGFGIPEYRREFLSAIRAEPACSRKLAALIEQSLDGP